MRRVIAGALLAVWLTLTFLSICPALHTLIHPDSQGPEHECFLTDFHKQTLHTSSPPDPSVSLPSSDLLKQVFETQSSPQPEPTTIHGSRAPPQRPVQCTETLEKV